MRRGCLIAVVAVLGLCGLACALGWFVPADTTADAITDGVNGVLAANNLRLTGIDLGDGQMTLQTEPASSHLL